jgi:hypothetical protein
MNQHAEHHNDANAIGFFETSRRMPGGEWSPWEIEPNLVVTEGLDYLISVALDGAAQKTTFYVALFGGNVTPVAGWTGANWVANATEFTNYTESTREIWDKGNVLAGSISNVDNPAVFTVGVGGGTIRGAALVEAAAKSATTGILFAAARFLTDKVLAATEELRVKYTISATAS